MGLIYSISGTIFPKRRWRQKQECKALIDSGREVNAIHPTYITKLGFRARKIDVSAKKIDKSHLDILRIVIVDYLVKNKLKSVQFF